MTEITHFIFLKNASADLCPHTGPVSDPEGPVLQICWRLGVKIRFTPSFLETSAELEMHNGFFPKSQVFCEL